MSDELSPEVLAESQRILEQKPRQYNYRSDFKGGRRNTDPEILKVAAVELHIARLVVETMRDRVRDARIEQIETMRVWMDAGIAVEFIAQHSGLYRPNVYRAVDITLPKLIHERDEAKRIIEQLQQGQG